MPEPPKDEGEVAIHTLLTREIRPISNWHEWLTCWQAAENLEWMESLLHVGFNVPLERGQYGEKEYVDRILFYFTIADGWADDSLLELPTDKDKEYVVGRDSNWNKIWKKPRELRQQLARKAFDMLCPKVFKVELVEGGRHGDQDQINEVWAGQVASERLLPVIQNFFRAEKDRHGDRTIIRNLSHGWRSERSHSEQQAEAFLLNLTNCLWKWKEPDTKNWGPDREEDNKRFAEACVRVDASKPWMVEVLAKLNRLDMLREWILQLDEACLAKLKEIAMRNEIHLVAKSRPVATLDEACFVGSKAAWLIKEYDLKTREYKRLNAIREAERQRAEAERKITELSGKK
jgi:hypothetical protein